MTTYRPKTGCSGPRTKSGRSKASCCPRKRYAPCPGRGPPRWNGRSSSPRPKGSTRAAVPPGKNGSSNTVLRNCSGPPAPHTNPVWLFQWLPSTTVYAPVAPLPARQPPTSPTKHHANIFPFRFSWYTYYLFVNFFASFFISRTAGESTFGLKAMIFRATSSAFCICPSAS